MRGGRGELLRERRRSTRSFELNTDLGVEKSLHASEIDQFPVMCTYTGGTNSETTPRIWRDLLGECDPLFLIWFVVHFRLILQRFCNLWRVTFNYVSHLQNTPTHPHPRTHAHKHTHTHTHTQTHTHTDTHTHSHSTPPHTL